MSNNAADVDQKAATQGKNQELNYTPEQIDWFLQRLVFRANNGVTLSAITITVGGLIISGELIGEKEYYKAVIAKVDQQFDEAIISLAESKFGEGKQSIEAKIKDLEDARDQQEETEDEDDYPQFIHLKNAKIYHHSGPPIPINQGVWWRGRLNAVDGFFLGSIQHETVSA